jgi:hypothetical protein
MQLDSSLYYGYFNFYIGHGLSVDEDLHRFIIESSNTEATSLIQKKLKRMSYDAFYEDHQLYLTAVGLDKIHPKKKAKTVSDMFPKLLAGEAATELSHLLNQRARAASAVTTTKLAFKSANIRANMDWSFNPMLPSKDNHNVHGSRNFLPGLGTTKLRKLMAANIDTCFELFFSNSKGPSSHQKHLVIGSAWLNHTMTV